MTDGAPLWPAVIAAAFTINSGVVAWLVYVLGRRQQRVTADQARRSFDLAAQNLRISVFDRRMAFFERYQKVRAQVSVSGSATRRTVEEAHSLRYESPFLFGDEVIEHLTSFVTLVDKLQRATSRQTSHVEETRLSGVELDAEALEELGSMSEQGDAVFQAAITLAQIR